MPDIVGRMPAADKPKLFDQVRDVMRTYAALVKELHIPSAI